MADRPFTDLSRRVGTTFHLYTPGNAKGVDVAPQYSAADQSLLRLGISDGLNSKTWEGCPIYALVEGEKPESVSECVRSDDEVCKDTARALITLHPSPLRISLKRSSC